MPLPPETASIWLLSTRIITTLTLAVAKAVSTFIWRSMGTESSSRKLVVVPWSREKWIYTEDVSELLFISTNISVEFTYLEQCLHLIKSWKTTTTTTKNTKKIPKNPCSLGQVRTMWKIIKLIFVHYLQRKSISHCAENHQNIILNNLLLFN